MKAAVCVGVDGCKAGWVAVARAGQAPPETGVHRDFASLLAAFPEGATIVVDMPIGLPERAGAGGRGPEMLVRRHLGMRQSSVFSIPSRAAVHAERGPFGSVEEWYLAHRRASAVARATSDPPRGVSIQAFGIFSKIREIDALLVTRPELRQRVIESHPEIAFWRLNGMQAMSLPKKIKGAVNPAGMEERRQLLAANGLPGLLLELPAPRGAGMNDFLDACAMLLVAERHVCGRTMRFPDPPLVDPFGIPIAIHV